jgi:predicted nucleic acid-binding protein
LKTLKSIEKLAVDANPILSALLGGNARTIFLSTANLACYTTLFNFREVEKYLPLLSSRRGLPLDELFLALSLLPLMVCDEGYYARELKKGRRLIGGRDPDDAPLLALSLKLKCPLWSNDKDFEEIGVTVYTTSDLLKLMAGGPKAEQWP